MAADAESSTGIEIHLQNLEGRLEPLTVTSPKATLEELQEPILQLFEKNISATTWVSLTMEGDTCTTPSQEPAFLRRYQWRRPPSIIHEE